MPTSTHTLQRDLAREKIARRLEVRGLSAADANTLAATGEFQFTTAGELVAVFGDARAVDTAESLDALAATLVARNSTYVPALGPGFGRFAVNQADGYDPVAAGKAAAASSPHNQAMRDLARR